VSEYDDYLEELETIIQLLKSENKQHQEEAERKIQYWKDVIKDKQIT
jgi:hypothetical protein